MNIEEIKHFKSLLRQGSLRHMNILLDDKFQKELQTIIEDYEKLQQKNQQLRIQISAREEEYKKLEDNWNELKEFMNYENISQLLDWGYETKDFISEIQNKMEDLERGVSDVKN